jgi:DNA-binding CsgD family transcriptional regulator
VGVAWPLTGRSKELRLIDAAISDRDSSGIVIRGGAGVGKSRIAREALAVAASKGHHVRWIVGTTSARAIPLGALASWVGPGGGKGLELVRGAIAALTSTSGGKTAVLGIDDAPLLDELSTFVVQQIVAHRAAKVVLTIRDSDPVAPATQELSHAGQFDRLDLTPLNRDDTAALLSAAFDGPVDPVAAERLWLLTRGNALYLRNIVEFETANDRLAFRAGTWQWDRDEVVVPPGLIESIEARIGALPPQVADVIDTLAVGEPLELGSLANITSAAAIEEADVRGLIALEPLEVGMEARVAHPLYGEVRRNRAASTRLRRLRGAVAAELAARHDESNTQIVMRRAALTIDSDAEPDPALLTRGAEWAVRLGDWQLAERLGRAAVRLGGGRAAIEILAYTLSLTGRGEEGNRLHDAIDPSTLSDADRATYACKRSGVRLFTLSDPVGAKKVLEDAAASLAPDAHTCIDAGFALYAAATGDATTAQQRMQKFAFDELPDHVVGQIANMGATILGTAGRVSEAIALAEKGRSRLAHSLDAAVVRYSISDAQIRTLLLAGRLPEALEVTERLRQEAMEMPGAGAVLAMALSCRATLGAGHVQTACTMLDPIVMTLTAMGENIGMRYQFLLMQATAHAMRGSPDQAVAALHALDQHRHPGWGCLDYEYAIASAWVSACQGLVGEAVATSLSGAETARTRGQFAGEVVCLQAAAQFGDHSRASRLVELEKIVEGPRPGLVRRFADALHSGDGAGLAAISGAYEEIGDPVVAADASAHAAIAYRRNGQRGSALVCVTRADALAKRCGTATPAVREAAEPIPLTSREREIASLLGQGVSTRDIAKRLSVSVRTVEGHVYRAMTKTGTTNRQELAALLTQRPDEAP